MDRTAYDVHLDLERRHFWRIAKQRLLRDTATRLPAASNGNLAILDIGGATSLCPRILSEFGKVLVIEPDEECAEAARKLLGTDVRSGRLPDAIDVSGPFDLITMLDVLEHIEDDRAALSKVRGILAPAGHLLLTVPALPCLYSEHDRALHHFRRYTRESLLNVLDASGFHTERVTYWTSLLLPLLAAQRGASAVRARVRRGKNGTPTYSVRVPPSPVNWVLGRVMDAERWILRHTNLPLGSSLLAVARPAG